MRSVIGLAAGWHQQHHPSHSHSHHDHPAPPPELLRPPRRAGDFQERCHFLAAIPSPSRGSPMTTRARNPLFRTVNYRPDYPSRPFASKDESCEWVASFVDWYNHRRHHSAIKFVTPNSATVEPPRPFASSEKRSTRPLVRPIQLAGAGAPAAGSNPMKCGSTSHRKSPIRSWRYH